MIWLINKNVNFQLITVIWRPMSINNKKYGKMLMFSYLLILIFLMGAKKNHLSETVLLSTHIICFNGEIRTDNFHLCTLILRPVFLNNKKTD